MAVRLVIGRAGSGKTWRCLNAIRGLLRETPDGPKLLLLVPEQASLQMERALLATPEIRSIHRAEVFSFTRLAHRILQEVKGTGPVVLSNDSRVMVVRHIVGRLGDELQVYGAVRQRSGLFEELAATLSELIEGAVTPEMLESESAALPGDPSAGTSRFDRHLLTKAKLRDLQRIYAAYLDFLGPNMMDPSARLSKARAVFDRVGWLHGAMIWVDGFAGFTRQEQLTLVELAKLAAEMEIALLFDPADWAQAVAGSHDPFRLFGAAEHTCRTLMHALAGAGVEMGQPALLDPPSPPRWSPAGVSTREATERGAALAALEARLFAVVPGAKAGEEAVRRPPPNIRLWEAANRRMEVEWAAAEILRLTRKTPAPMRYRDVAVIVRDLEPYHALVAAAFESKGIPYFIDWRRRTAHHALVEMLRALVRMACESMSLGSVRLLLKTGLTGIADERLDELENYLLAHGIEGLEAWTGEDWHFRGRRSRRDEAEDADRLDRRTAERVNATRRELLESIHPWLSAAAESPVRSVLDWTRRLYDILANLDVPSRIEGWAVRAEEQGRPPLAAEHRQVWTDTVQLLDDMVESLGEQKATIAEFADILETGLAQFRLGLAPPALDEVLVGAVERSRHPELRAVFVLGFNDGVFPSAARESSILNDDDRQYLEAGGTEIGRSRRNRLLDERMLTYVALTRSSETLHVSFAATDEQGKELRPSPYIEWLRAAVPCLRVEQVGSAEREGLWWDVATAEDLADRLAWEIRRHDDAQPEHGDREARVAALYDVARRRADLQPLLRRALSGLVHVNRADLNEAARKMLFADPLRVSISKLEAFSACPFRFFAECRLKLEPREEYELGSLEAGTLDHAILEDFFNQRIADGQGVDQLDDDAILASLDRLARHIAPLLHDEALLARPVAQYAVRRCGMELSNVIRAAKTAARAGRFRPAYTELKFGLEEGGLPPVTIRTPSGRTVEFRGVIDRVDLAEVDGVLLGIVIDYKRTLDKRLDLNWVYHGLSLQLPAYLLAIRQLGETLRGQPIQPVGAFYVSLVGDYKTVTHPNDVADPDEHRCRPHRFHGLFDKARLHSLDGELTPSSKSRVVNAYMTKDGGVGNIEFSDAVDSEGFESIIARTERKIGELADRVNDGVIDVRPGEIGDFRACSWCEYGAVCRFELSTGEVAALDRRKRTEVLTKLKATIEP